MAVTNTKYVKGDHQIYFTMFVLFIIKTSFEMESNSNYSLQPPSTLTASLASIGNKENAPTPKKKKTNKIHDRQTVPLHIAKLPTSSALLGGHHSILSSFAYPAPSAAPYFTVTVPGSTVDCLSTQCM